VTANLNAMALVWLCPIRDWIRLWSFRLEVRITIKTWFDGQSTRCRCELGRPRGRDAYVHNVQACEHGDEEGPGRSANLDCPEVAVQDVGLQTDPVPVELYELWEALHGDVDGFLDG